MHKTDIEGYTGEGEPPPAIETIIKAESHKTTPPDLTVEAMLKGVQKPNFIEYKIEAENVVECVCQVFYHKVALNHWRTRVSLFPKCHKKVNLHVLLLHLVLLTHYKYIIFTLVTGFSYFWSK